MIHTLEGEVGRFQILEKLGHGGMGAVYKAHDPAIGRPVAIKMLHASTADGTFDEDSVNRLRHEAGMAGRCHHPNIVSIFDLGMHQATPFLVMEFVDGEDLTKLWLKDSSTDALFVIRVVLQVLDALNYAHAIGIIHRDIKPANIMITRDGRAKVTDFGIARALSASSETQKVMLGSPCYMSPEQCLGGPVDGRTDLFSLGSVIYEMLAGQRAFSGANVAETIAKIVHQHPPSLNTVQPNFPRTLVMAVEKALAKLPTARFQSAADMTRALQMAAVELQREVVLNDQGATVAWRPVADLPNAVTASKTLTRRSQTAIERHLAQHIGPIARHHVNRALRDQPAPAEFIKRLELFVPELARPELRTKVLAIVKIDGGLDPPDPPSPDNVSNTPMSETAIRAISRAVSQIQGPIGSKLVQRALQKVDNVDALCEECLTMVSNVQERETLRKLLQTAVLGTSS